MDAPESLNEPGPVSSSGGGGGVEVGEAQSSLHLLPCDIDYDGPAPVNSFFQMQVSERGARGKARGAVELVGAFRGRELVGAQMSLPQANASVTDVTDVSAETGVTGEKGAVTGVTVEAGVSETDADLTDEGVTNKGVTGVTGVVAVGRPVRDKAEAQWEAIGGFDQVTLWAHDVPPQTECLQELLDWFPVAEALHSL
ncbi:ribonuclease H2, subunit C [Ochromonadaceae sp. CCMP2298]|nr:ribonuclease H2, subunit C [Ochromonadaceae sp. CCMP2298]|mmetsp:Transcript_2246/g.5297  ORF Transcript_2246/g.5297 Transcript_2246/m.5297 type:complete len:198 (-) Transcript_2246:167-760(-)